MRSKAFYSNISIIFFLLVNLFLQSSAFAQATNEDLDVLVSDTKSDLLVVVGGGLAGAVLGLSTLSFVDEPKDHTRNIIVGASIGIIFGVGYVAFSQATKTQEMMYGPEDEVQAKLESLSPKDLDTYTRSEWHYENQQSYTSYIASPYQLNYSIKF